MDHIAQAPPVKVLHHEVGRVVRLDHLVNGDNMLVTGVTGVGGILHLADRLQKATLLDEVLQAVLDILGGLTGVLHRLAVCTTMAAALHEVLLDGELHLRTDTTVADDAPHLVSDAEAALTQHLLDMVLIVLAVAVGHHIPCDDCTYWKCKLVFVICHKSPLII